MMSQTATAECCEMSHINFLWIQESILCVLGGENLFQYEHFYERLKWTTLMCESQALISRSQVVST